jgi:putative transposase
MAKARLLAPWVGEERRSAIYHCVSRVVDRRFVLGDV